MASDGETREAASSKSHPSLRSAIYTEPIGEEERDAATAATGRNTYRCYSTVLPDVTLSLESFTPRSVFSCGTTARVERRCKIDDDDEAGASGNVRRDEATRCIPDDGGVDGERRVSNEPEDLARRVAHTEWMRGKCEAARRKRQDEELATRRRREEEEETARRKAEKARLEEENFLKWVEGKKRLELDRRATFRDELELQKRVKELEEKAAVAKTLCLRQWVRKKTDERKARHKEQESRQRKINEEREKRMEQCSKAYERWRQNSKDKPKPATQGLLPHQKAKPAYVNPIPWQSIVEVESDEAREEDALNEENEGASRRLRRTVAAHR